MRTRDRETVRIDEEPNEDASITTISSVSVRLIRRPLPLLRRDCGESPVAVALDGHWFAHDPEMQFGFMKSEGRRA